VAVFFLNTVYIVDGRWRYCRPETPPGPPKENPPAVSTPVECSKAKLCKLTLTPTPDPIRPTRRGPDPNRRTGVTSGGGFSRVISGGCLEGWLCAVTENKKIHISRSQVTCNLQYRYYRYSLQVIYLSTVVLCKL